MEEDVAKAIRESDFKKAQSIQSEIDKIVELEKLQDAKAKAIRESDFSKAKELQSKIDDLGKSKTSTNQTSRSGKKNYLFYFLFILSAYFGQKSTYSIKIIVHIVNTNWRRPSFTISIHSGWLGMYSFCQLMTAYMPTFIGRNITGIRPTHDCFYANLSHIMTAFMPTLGLTA